jgi:hypothetical protein
VASVYVTHSDAALPRTGRDSLDGGRCKKMAGKKKMKGKKSGKKGGKK